jgi:POT family proton-dependent oligopeptide transporter
VLFFTELWERFAYYGMRGLLILYLIDTAGGGLGWGQQQASRFYGWFIGLAYPTLVAGGWLADRYLGTNRSLLIGGAILTLSHFSLALGAFYAGVALIILGTGFFKSNVHTMVGQLYQPDDPGRDSGFTLYYMGINLGAFFGPLVCAWLAARYGWPYRFAGAGAGILAGTIFYALTRGRQLRGVGRPPPRPARTDQASARPDGTLTSEEWRRILALAIITFFVVFFWLAFEQVGSSLNVFAAQRTERAVRGWPSGLAPNGEIPAAWFQAVNPFFILLLAPLMASLWQRLGPAPRADPPRCRWGSSCWGSRTWSW